MKQSFLRPVFWGLSTLLSTLVLTNLTGCGSSNAVSPPVISLISNRADLGSDDRLDWSSLATTQPLPQLSNTFTATSTGGLRVQVEIPAATQAGITPPLVFQTAPAPGIPTNFNLGDYILFTGLQPGVLPAPGNPGPIILRFDQPVAGFGTQMAVDETPQFTGFLTAYDSQGTKLGSFVVPGISSWALDGSASFMGVRSNLTSIARIEISSSESNRAMGINALNLRRSP